MRPELWTDDIARSWCVLGHVWNSALDPSGIVPSNRVGFHTVCM